MRTKQKVMRLVRLFIAIGVLLGACLLLVKMGNAAEPYDVPEECTTFEDESFKWQWKISEQRTETGEPFWYVFLVSPKENALAISVRRGGMIVNGPLVFFDPRLHIKMHFIANVPGGGVVSPLRPLLYLDDQVFELYMDTKFKSFGPGYVWAFESTNDAIIERLKRAKKLAIHYLVFLNDERHDEFKLKGIADAIASAISDAAKPVISKKPAHIVP